MAYRQGIPFLSIEDCSDGDGASYPTLHILLALSFVTLARHLGRHGTHVLTVRFPARSRTGEPVIDETKVQGAYEIKLNWDPKTPGSLEDAVRKLGLDLVFARRPIEFLVMSRTN